jgi:hypothetical protein
MEGTAFRRDNFRVELIRSEPWSEWRDVWDVVPVGLQRPPGGVYQVRVLSNVYRHTSRLCSSRTSCRFVAQRIGPDGHLEDVFEHNVTNGVWRCEEIVQEVRGGTLEFRVRVPVNVDFHVVSLLARRGSVLTLESTGRLNFRIDGEDLKPVPLDTSGWSAGAHYIDWFDDGEASLGQLVLHVVEPVSLAVSPRKGTVTLDAEKGGANGFFSEVVVRNQTADQQIVSLDVASVPVGWNAFLVSDPLLVLEPGEKATCRVQVELMSSIGVRRKVQPVVISARTAAASVDEDGKPVMRDIAQSCQIHPRVKAEADEFERIKKLLGDILVL